jgi:hypothetical protein
VRLVNRRPLFGTRDGPAAMVSVPGLSAEDTPPRPPAKRGDSLYLTGVDSPIDEGRPTSDRGRIFGRTGVEWVR